MALVIAYDIPMESPGCPYGELLHNLHVHGNSGYLERRLSIFKFTPYYHASCILMDYECIGCGSTYEHKTGLNNHRRYCYKYKEFDGWARRKRRRLDQESQVPLEASGSAQPNDLVLEVHKLVFSDLLTSIDYW